jgi:hypothetical protein
MPSALTEEQQRERDTEHLKLLGIFYYVVGGMTICFSSLAILHVVMGIAMVLNPKQIEGGAPFPEAIFGLMFAFVGVVVILTGWTLGLLTIGAGRCIQTRRHRFYILVISGIICLFYPFGTALGVAAFFVLSRDSVKRMFAS